MVETPENPEDFSDESTREQIEEVLENPEFDEGEFLELHGYEDWREAFADVEGVAFESFFTELEDYKDGLSAEQLSLIFKIAAEERPEEFLEFIQDPDFPAIDSEILDQARENAESKL